MSSAAPVRGTGVPATSVPSPTATRAAIAIPLSRRLTMVAMGYIPFLNFVVIVTLAVLPSLLAWPRWTSLAPLVWLLIVPPVVVRLTLALRPLDTREIPLGTREFLRWWFTSQWQVIFNRLPWIEEVIRLVPGLYSMWLRLWGAKVGGLVYWTPGMRILDRSFVDVGKRVVFGVGVRINPHIIMPNDGGELVLRLGRVRIGDDALVGGYSTLFAGAWIAAGEATPGKREHRPFTGWQNGRRVLPDDGAGTEAAGE